MTTNPIDTLEADLVAMIIEEITFGQPVETETDLLLTGLVDSIGVIRIVTWIEEHLEIEIDPGDVLLENFQTVALIVQYVKNR